jgi:hypothetical protein
MTSPAGRPPKSKRTSSALVEKQIAAVTPRAVPVGESIAGIDQPQADQNIIKAT